MSIIIARIIGIIGGVSSVIALGFFYFFPGYYSAGIILALWWAATILIGIKLSFTVDDLAAHIGASSAFFVLLGVLEWAPAEILLMIGSGLVFTILWWWPTIGRHNPAQFTQKPWRRIIMVIWVFAVYSWMAALNAILLFFPDLPVLFISALEGAIAAFATFMILRLYNPGKKLKDCAFGIGSTAVMVAELGLVISFLPFGYLASALVTAWIWYLIQLFLRFQLSPEGIIWRKQSWFLVGNAVLLFLTLYYSQWI
ncbi:MAG: hypothetical protein AAB390_03770 [Patescibacteria group bacterium]